MEPNRPNHYFGLPPDVDMLQYFDPQLDGFDLIPPAVPPQHVAAYSHDTPPPYNSCSTQHPADRLLDSHNALQHVLHHSNLQQHEFQQLDTHAPASHVQSFQQPGLPQPNSSQFEIQQPGFSQLAFQQHVFQQPDSQQPGLSQSDFSPPDFQRPLFQQSNFYQHDIRQPGNIFDVPGPSRQVFAPSTFQQFGDPSFTQSLVGQQPDRGDLQQSRDFSSSRSPITPLPLPSPPQHIHSRESASQISDGDEKSNSDAGIVQSHFLNGGYWSSWKHYDQAALYDIELAPISHVNYAFAEVENDGTVKLKNSNIHYNGRIDEVNQELLAWLQRRQDYPKLKIMVSIGGGAFSETAQTFANVAASLGKRLTFATSIKKLVKSYELDGIDINWEYPASKDEGLNYALLLREVRRTLGWTPWVSIALPANKRVLSLLPLSRISRYVSFINLMTYDFFGLDPVMLGTTSHHAQLYADALVDEAEYITCGDAAVTYLHDCGVLCRKIMLGIALYGRVLKGATGPGQPFDGLRSDLDFAPEVKDLPLYGMKQTFDKEACAAFISGIDEFVTYDSVMSVREKAQYVKRYNLRGLFYWHLAGDGYGDESLINAAYEVFSTERD